MLELILVGLRWLLLGIFYLFLAKLIWAIIKDMRSELVDFSDNNHLFSGAGGDGAALIVLASTDYRINPGTKILLGDHTKIIEQFVSAQHAVINYQEGQYWLADRDSLNGTYLNEVKVEQMAVLAGGDRVRVGGVSF
ncbi:FHA domain-containing protein, partial [Peptococcaceae bacterium]|nr:FHA domain-containing protein [Peptococcaceae bacterium]